MSDFNVFAEIDRATEQWKLAHPFTFADVQLGEEFVDQYGITWEKRSERRALAWYEGEPPELVEFAPTEPVRLK